MLVYSTIYYHNYKILLSNIIAIILCKLGILGFISFMRVVQEYFLFHLCLFEKENISFDQLTYKEKQLCTPTLHRLEDRKLFHLHPLFFTYINLGVFIVIYFHSIFRALIFSHAGSLKIDSFKPSSTRVNT